MTARRELGPRRTRGFAMASGSDGVFNRWRRRRWQPNAAALSAFVGLTPVTVITGASEGIGRAMAEQWAAQGHDLLLVARDVERLNRVAATLRLSSQAKVSVLALDVTMSDAPTRIDAALADLESYADVLLNNAGIGLSGPFVEATPAAIDTVIALNVMAATRLARHLLPGMLVRGRGGILFVASLAGYTPGPGQAVYYASKAYVISLSEALAVEATGQGVRITCVAPGPVDTAFHAKMGADTALYRTAMPGQSADRVARLALLAFRLGARTVVPGLLASAMMVALRLLPHRLTVPVVATLLRPPAVTK